MPRLLRAQLYLPDAPDQEVIEEGKFSARIEAAKFRKDLIDALHSMWRDMVQTINPCLHQHGENPDATLSGTPKVFEVLDESGTTYYFKAYPTKT